MLSRNSANNDPELSVVIPIYNEAPILEELIDRCQKALIKTQLKYELILVNDGSTDHSYQILSNDTHPTVEVIHLRKNQGQFKAVQSGLKRSRGKFIITLDGDMQDPPELIPALVNMMVYSQRHYDVVFALKQSRHDSMLVNILTRVYQTLQCLLCKEFKFHGAGNFLIMRKEMAGKIISQKYKYCNLAPILFLHAKTIIKIDYQKMIRHDKKSHVGLGGLLKEGLTSLYITGALFKLIGFLIILLLLFMLL
jgi:glycosyltransferase involved in cell wall biosynthesis